MTKRQLKELESLTSQIGKIAGRIRKIAEAEQGKFDKLDAWLQQAKRGKTLQEGVDTLNGVADALEEASDDIFFMFFLTI